MAVRAHARKVNAREKFVKTATRFAMLEDIAGVTRAMRRRGIRQWTPRAYFTMYRQIRVGNARIGLTLGVHVAPPGAGYPRYRAIVGVHPTSRIKARGGWHPALLRANWYEQCARHLRRYGYRGAWYVGPYGRFGDFERRVSTRAALLSELEPLERLYSEPWPESKGIA